MSNTSMPKTQNIRTVGLALLAIVLIALPFLLSPYGLHIAMTLGIAIILALSLNLLMGYAGQISLANAAFYGIGAYTVAIFGNVYGVPFWIALPLVGFLTAGVGLIVGLPALRVSGHYLALATLAFVSSVQVILVNWVSVTGGSPGFNTSRTGLGISYLEDDRSYYFVIAVVTVVMVILAVRIIDSKIGRAFMAIRDNENAAEIMGVNLTKYKTMAFGINAFYCAIAGGLQAGLVRFLDPYEFGLWPSIWHMLYIVVGGLGSVLGSILGPLVLVALPESLRVFAEYRELIFAVVLLLALIFMPEGIAGLAWSNIVGKLRVGGRRAKASPSDHVQLNDSAILATRHPSVRPEETVLEVQDLSLSFGGLKALQKVNLTLKEPVRRLSLIACAGCSSLTVAAFDSGARKC